MVYSLKIMNIRLHFYDSLSNSGWDIWVDCQIKFAAPKPMQCYAKNKTKTAFCYYCWTLDIILVPVMIIFAICAMIFCMDVFDHKCITSPVRLQLCVHIVFFFSHIFTSSPVPVAKGRLLSGRVYFLMNSIHPAVCLRCCCRGDAGFHVGSPLHTEREGEKWEIIALPASLNLGHRASGGNKPGSFSLWVTVGQDCCGGSLLLFPSALTLQMASLSLLLSPYCFIISVLPSTKIDEMLSCVSD